MIKRFKRWLAKGVMWFWRKVSLESAIAWAWLMRNGKDNGPEDLDRYIDIDEDNQ